MVCFFIIFTIYICTDSEGGLLAGHHSPIIPSLVGTGVAIVDLVILGLGLVIQPLKYNKSIEKLKKSNRLNKYLILGYILIVCIGMLYGGLTNTLALSIIALWVILVLNIITLSIQNGYKP